jgi:hypothetical protein
MGKTDNTLAIKINKCSNNGCKTTFILNLIADTGIVKKNANVKNKLPVKTNIPAVFKLHNGKIIRG